MERNLDNNLDPYVQNLKKLSIVRESCGGKLELPQMVVVGSTSQGKSTALGLITGLKFPTNTSICTLAPCIVECKKDNSVTSDQYFITTSKSKNEVRCSDIKDLADEINSAQNELDNSEISETEIRVKVVGPSRDDLILIDLPGLIVNGTDEEKKRVRCIIETYCKPERSLMLVVSAAGENEKNIEAIDIAKRYDPAGSRTLRILSKFDVFDSQESRNQAVEIVGAKEKLELGPHAIIARTTTNGEYDPKQEEELLNAQDLSALPSTRKGIKTLRDRLPKLFANLINTNINPLLNDVRDKLKNARKELNEIGAEPQNTTMLLSKCQTALDNDLFGRQITPSLEEFQENIHKSKNNVTKEWTSKRLGKDVTRAPFFQGEDGFLKCLAEINEWWKPILGQFKISAQEILVNSISEPIESIDVPKHLKESIKRQWTSYCAEEIFPEFNKDCDKVLVEEKNFGTMNHYLTTKYGQEMVLPTELFDMALAKISLTDRFEMDDDEWSDDGMMKMAKLSDNAQESIKSKIRESFENASKEWATKYTSKTLHEQQVDCHTQKSFERIR